MSPINKVIKNNQTDLNPIWIMRQAGRYLPEFREIRKENPNFIKLCLNPELSTEITLQPIKRYDFDAAIIFSDILMIPYGIGQHVEFKKNLGPQMKDLNVDQMLNLDEKSFSERLSPIYELIKNLKNKKELANKDIIGFVGAPWTLLVYMINKASPKNGLNKEFFDDKKLIKDILRSLDKFIKIHIKNQIQAGATIIQIFDSWAGLLSKNLDEYIYNPTTSIVNYVKSLNIPTICFPRQISNYTEFCNIVKPDMISIDYNVDPKYLLKNINIPIQGGLDPKILLTDRENLKKETIKYLELFKDHPYVFNLGHGILPETKTNMVQELINIVRSYK